MPSYNWPEWLKDFLPDWLENVRCPTTGVGDLQDLRLSIGVSEGGRWIGFVNTGWYYHDYKEQYNYVVRGKIETAVGPGSGTITAPLSYRPSWGPVLLHGVADEPSEENDGPYIQHHNSLYPQYNLTWAQHASGALYVAQVPTGTVLVGLRDLTQLPLGSVAGTGDVINEKFYYFDEVTYKIYIRPKNSSNIEVWADLLYTEPLLRMREIVVVEEDGLRASYKLIEDVKAIRGNQTKQLVTGLHSGGYLTNTLTGTVLGDWVVLDYWIRKSYVLRDHKTLQYYSTYNLFDQVELSFETSLPDTVPSLKLKGFGDLNLNPIFSDSHRAGYLFHTNYTPAASGLWVPKEVLVGADKFEICAAWREQVKITALVLDKDGLPVPWYPVSVTLSNGASAIIHTPNGRTDGRGEVHLLVQPSTGSTNFTCTVSCSGIVGQITIDVKTRSEMIPLQRFKDGVVNLVIDEDRTPRGHRIMWVGNSSLDGIPKAIDSSRPVVVRSDLGTAFEWQNQLFVREATLFTSQLLNNPFAIVRNASYERRKGDRIIGILGEAQSQILEFPEDE